MQRGYRKPRNLFLPKIGAQFQTIDREKQLEKQLKRIDEILKTDHLYTLHGLIFTDQLKNRLPEDILNCINKQHRLISYGFQLFSEKVSNQKTLANGETSFKKKLEEMSALKLQRFQGQKHTNHEKRPWRILIGRQNTENKKYTPANGSTCKHSYLSYTQEEESAHSIATTPNKVNPRRRHYQKVITQPEEHFLEKPGKDELTLQKIDRMLGKIQSSVFTIWLPPKSYPQFYGLIVPSVAVTKSSGVRCRIKKYILFRHSLSTRLFEAMLQYLSEKFEAFVDRIEMIVRKEEYHNYLEAMEWKIESWEGTDKISVSYMRKQP